MHTYDAREDFIERVEEAQRAIAWVTVLYEEFYDKRPSGTWSELMCEYVELMQNFKKELAEEPL